MKKFASTLAAMLIVALIALTAAAATYNAISLPTRGEYTPAGIGVGKAQQIECSGSTIASGTVAIYRLSPSGTTSNLLVICTNSSGAVSYDISGRGIWIKAGDRLFRAGTATNGAVHLIVAE
jgi:hypothetical protein